MVVGTRHRFDQFMNLVVVNTVEVNGDKTNIGLVVIRGNNIVTVEGLKLFLQVLKALHAPKTVMLVPFVVGSVLITFMWARNLYKRPKIIGA